MDLMNSAHQILMFPLPEGWSTGFCIVTKRYYYINNYTNKTQWNRPITPAPRNYPRAIKCTRILIKHKESDHEFWRRNYITRTKKEASHLISKCYVLITSKQFTFEEVSFKYSECPFARRGGDVQWLNLCTASPYIANFTFNLEVGEITLPVETPQGFEIFMRKA